MKQHLQQIDVVKGLAIVMVLLLHSLSRGQLEQSYAVVHIWQAVPLFMVVMGLNLGLATQSRAPELAQLYTRNYFSKKASRILVPFVQVFLLSIPVGYIWQWVTGTEVVQFDLYNLIGMLPVSGRGNYFITLLLQSILLLPLVGYGFSRRPVLCSFFLVGLEVIFQVWAANFTFFNQDNYLYDAAFPRYFSAIVLGLWLAKSVRQERVLLHWLIYTLIAVPAVAILFLLLYKDLQISFLRPEWALQQATTFGYAAWLVWVALQAFPAQSGALPLRVLAQLGQASYHIFLLQVLYFGLVDKSASLWLNVPLCLALGYLYFRLEPHLTLSGRNSSTG